MEYFQKNAVHSYREAYNSFLGNTDYGLIINTTAHRELKRNNKNIV